MAVVIEAEPWLELRCLILMNDRPGTSESDEQSILLGTRIEGMTDRWNDLPRTHSVLSALPFPLCKKFIPDKEDQMRL